MMDLFPIVVPSKVLCRSDDFEITYDSTEGRCSPDEGSSGENSISIKSVSIIYYTKKIEKKNVFNNHCVVF
jgi:hypothetical protein